MEKPKELVKIMRKLNIAIIGFGRSGCDIHGRFLRSAENDICNVKYVVEADPARAAAAREIFGCETLEDYRELYDHVEELDFVTNTSYSDLHYPITKDLMEHGFHVLCEKPLCRTTDMVQDLIDTAKANNVLFTVFHQYRFNDYYVQMKRLLKAGVIGEVKLIRGTQSGFLRRYDWQTLQSRDAGAMRNNAAHYIEMIMDLAESDELPRITSHLDIWNSVGDAEDYMFARFHYAKGPVCEIEVNPADAFNGEQPIFKIFGTKGTMKVYNDKIYYKSCGDAPAPVLDPNPLHKADGTPAYCDNKLEWQETEVTLDADVWNVFSGCTDRFYHAWYETLVNGGELFIKPEHIKAQIAIFQEIQSQNPQLYK